MNIAYIREIGWWNYALRATWLAIVQRLLKRDLPFRLPSGLVMILPRDSLFGREVFYTDADVDWGSEALFMRFLDPQGDFIDAGANIGYYSLYAAPLVRRVLAFEPDPRNHPALQANASRSQNIHLHWIALSATSGTAHLDVSQPTTNSHLLDNESSHANGLSVETRSLDDLVQQDSALRITGIKIDTEGHELPILHGGVKTIAAHQPLILVELQAKPNEAIDDFLRLQEFAHALSYELFAYVRHLRRYQLMPVQKVEDYSTRSTKMIFLVPQRLRAAFLAECNPSGSIPPKEM
jgi:FkbM family methyltransferase